MDPAKLKVVDLRAQLSQRGLDAKGNKAVLVERLRKALEEENASDDGGKASENVDSIPDVAPKEHNEKPTESAKTSQPPKTSGRTSRSSTLATPTKISTRSTPRTSATPNSTKQVSTSKTQRAESPCETLSAISESIPQEERPATPPKKIEERDEDDRSANFESNSSLSCSTKDGDAPEEISPKEENKDEASVSQVSVIKSPTKSNEFVDRLLDKLDCSLERKTEGGEEAAPIPVIKEDVVGGTETVENPENVNDDEEERVVGDTFDNDKEVPKTEEEKCLKPEENAACSEDADDDNSDEKSMDTPKEVPSSDDSCNQRTDAVDSVENEENNAVHEPTKEEPIADATRIEDMDVTKEADDVSCDESKAQDVGPLETKEDERMEVDTKKQQDKNDAKNRKRKRSPSPMEDRRASPAPRLLENEPEIDDSALILSWYDSDLNLVIDKNGFFTATPMHNDGFSHMWAGARASYGFLCGKVYYEAKITEHCTVNIKNDEHPHVLRIGWSALHTSMQLGEEKISYGYDSTGKKSTENRFADYGPQFRKDDVIGCYLDATSENDVVLSYTVNGEDLGTAFSISKQELGDKPLFPHILSKNCSFACNFGQEKPWTEEILLEYVSIGNVEAQYKVPGPRRPEKKEECEVIMMCGLPACGKTTWAMKHATEHPQKMYNVLGLDSLIDKMKDMGLPFKENYTGQWEILIDKCIRALDKLMELAPTRRRNYIIDQTNVYPSVQRRKMKNFSGYQRKAVVVVPAEEEFKLRASKHKPIEGKEIAESVLLEMKANFSVPVVGESFEDVSWVEVNEEEGRKLIERFNKEGKDAGYNQQQTNKRLRLDSRAENNRECRDVRNSRDTRDHRDHRDRRGNYSERNRNSMWRGGGGSGSGGGSMGWRDRPQRGGGHVRHGGGYGPLMPWRGRGGGPVPPSHRGLDRRGGGGGGGGGGDRRAGNDRGRSGGSRQGGWAPMSNYQGSQQSVWNQSNNWPSSGQSQGGWGQQSNWGSQHWGNWKGYGQGSYNQSNYNQQGYGNGNWNSWNQQYYNQYWGQQQQTGQATAAGGQAASTTESATIASSGESTLGYDYSQEWQGYPQEYTSGQSGRQYRSTQVSTTQVENKFFHNK